MNQIITHSNILNPYDLKVIQSTARHSSEIVKDLLIDDAYEVVLSKNSVIQDEPFDIVEGDVINVMFIPKSGGSGGGNKVTRTLMMLVVAVASAYTGGAVGAAYGSIFGAVAAGGVAIAGGLLVNAILPVATATNSLNSSDFSSSTTYSWDESYNKFTQGIPVPKVFGTHKITPPLISKFIESIDNKQYWNGLYALNDGVINSVSDIKINDESIDNFDNVTYEIRYGHNDQLSISNFDNTKSDKEVGKKLKTTYVETVTDGNEVTALSATLMFPRGIFYATDSGTIGEYSVKIVVEISSDGVNWERIGGNTDVYNQTNEMYTPYGSGTIGHFNAGPFSTSNNFVGEVSAMPYNVKHASYWGYSNPNGAQYSWPVYLQYTLSSLPYTTISATETSTIRKTFSVSGLVPAQYKIRAKFYEAPNSSSRYGSDCYLEYITEEIGDDFTYPGTALLAIRALATDQLSGSKPTISCVLDANSSNPALIAKQMLLESGISENRILPSFNDWQAHCDVKGYEFNGVFDTSMTLRKALDLVSTIGRASIVQFGSKFEVIMDRAEEIPVQRFDIKLEIDPTKQGFTFGMGNILKDSFKQTFLPILDRANIIAITYTDRDLDFNPTIVEVSSGNYDSVAEENRVSIDLVGCTSRTQAIKEGRFRLNCNRILTETATLEADKDSLVCKYGSIVGTSHDTPQNGFSGRLVDCSLTTVIIDREVTFETGKNYCIQVKNSKNNVVEHYINNTENTTDILEFTHPIITPYEQYDNYSFGEVGKASKLYRVLKIGTSSEQMRKLTLLEYNEDVYNDSEEIDVPIITALGLRNLRATDYIRYSNDGSVETIMQLSWSGEALSYTVQYRKDTDAYTSVKVFTNKLDVVVSDANYDIIVSDSYGKSLSLNYQVLGKLNPPEPVTNLKFIEQQDEFKLSWDYAVYPIDFLRFEVYANGILVSTQNTQTCNLPITGSKQTVRVYAVDTTNNKSNFEEVVLIASTLEDIEAINVLYENNQQNLYWLKIASLKTPIIYEVRKGDSWDYGQVVGVTSEVTLKAVTNGNYMVKPFYTTKYGAKIYSPNFVSVLVDGGILPKNIIASFAEHGTWDGDKTNTTIYDGALTLESNVLFDDILDFDAIQNLDFPNNTVYGMGYYESKNIVNIGSPQLCKINVDFVALAENLLSNFDSIMDFDAVSNFDGYTAGDFSINVQISISQDGFNYGAWKPFAIGDYLGQSFKIRLVLITLNQNIRPIITSFSFSIDMPDRFEQGAATTPTAITFTKPFNMKPYTQITLSNAISGDDIELINETNEGFILNVKNNGNDVVRMCNWYTSGY